MATSTAAEQGPGARRQAQTGEALRPDTMRWMAGLPGELRPRHLPIEFTRIANELGRRWPFPEQCLEYFDDLLMDKRGDRKGFPMSVAFEISYLKGYYETKLHPRSQTVWDELAERSLR